MTFYDLFARHGLTVIECYWYQADVKRYFVVEGISPGGLTRYEFESPKQAAYLAASNHRTFRDYLVYENA